MDANTTVLRVLMADGELYSVSAYALGDQYSGRGDQCPDRLRDAHARLKALRERVVTDGTVYTSDRVRFVAHPVLYASAANFAPWPAGVAVPPVAGPGDPSPYLGVRTADLSGEAAAQLIAALPDGPHLSGPWTVVRAPDDDDVLFAVAWRYLTPDE
jgi:hypothetical protein